jgi:cell division protein YceG involved in septum cleavage
MIVRKSSAAIGLLIVTFVGVFYGYALVTGSPSGFPVAKNFVVNENETLGSLSLRLEEEHYVVSSFLFRAWVSFLGHDRHIKAGVYTFDVAKNLGGVVEKFVFGKPDAPLLSVTIPEGSTSFEVAQAFHKVANYLCRYFW